MPEHKAEPRARTVTFLLPGGGSEPVGGFKVAYEYANGLAERGWKVRVVHPCILTSSAVDGGGSATSVAESPETTAQISGLILVQGWSLFALRRPILVTCR